MWHKAVGALLAAAGLAVVVRRAVSSRKASATPDSEGLLAG
jgi:hypothetical protein